MPKAALARPLPTRQTRQKGRLNFLYPGLRIDVILASQALQGRLKDAGIDYELRGMEKPSDHAPIWLELT